MIAGTKPGKIVVAACRCVLPSSCPSPFAFLFTSAGNPDREVPPSTLDVQTRALAVLERSTAALHHPMAVPALLASLFLRKESGSVPLQLAAARLCLAMLRECAINRTQLPLMLKGEKQYGSYFGCCAPQE
jgi:hypothetical protein